MNEYLTTFLVEEHRRDLLAEARLEALAREARAGRPSWWHRLFARSTDAPTERTAAGEGPDGGQCPDGLLAGSSEEAPHFPLPAPSSR